MLKVGIIGLGEGENHIKLFKKVSNVKVLAIADIDRGKLESISKTYDIPQTFTNYKDLLDVKDIDAVTVALPNYLHCPVVIDALERNKHVLVEKPMALNAREAEKMVRKAREKKKCLVVRMNYRFLPEMTFLKRLIEQGYFGRIYCIKARYMRRMTFEDKKALAGSLKDRTWFVEKAKSGGWRSYRYRCTRP